MSFGSPDGTFLCNITVLQSMRRLKLKTVLAIKATRNMQNLSCQGHPHKSYQPSCLQHPPRRRRFESTPIPEQRFHQLIWQLNSCSNLTVLSLSEATSELKSDMQKKTRSTQTNSWSCSDQITRNASEIKNHRCFDFNQLACPWMLKIHVLQWTKDSDDVDIATRKPWNNSWNLVKIQIPSNIFNKNNQIVNPQNPRDSYDWKRCVI